MAWPQVMTHIEDNAMDEAHGKLSWYRDQYDDVTKNAKSLEEKPSSEKEHCCEVEIKQAELKNL